MTLLRLIDEAEHASELEYKFGLNRDTQSPEDVAIMGDVYMPDQEEIVFLQSNDTNDADQDTGAWNVFVYGLDDEFKKINELVVMDGQNAVQLEHTYRRIYRMKVVPPAGDTGSNEGTIIARNAGGDVFAAIGGGEDGGDNQTQQAAYTVPADTNGAELLWWRVSLSNRTAAAATLSLKVREPGGLWTTKSSGRCSENHDWTEHLRRSSNEPGLIYQAGTDIKFRVEGATANGLEISAVFRMREYKS
jgi:hypothetical protein